jgi:hypothetical protein
MSQCVTTIAIAAIAQSLPVFLNVPVLRDIVAKSAIRTVVKRRVLMEGRVSETPRKQCVFVRVVIRENDANKTYVDVVMEARVYSLSQNRDITPAYVDLISWEDFVKYLSLSLVMKSSVITEANVY